MIGLDDAANIVAIMNAMADVIRTGRDQFEAFYERQLESPNIGAEAERVRAALSTYSDREIEEIMRRIEGCRDRFVEQGGGEERVRCFCSVLDEVKIGNGGTLPDVDDWRGMYDQLDCPR